MTEDGTPTEDRRRAYLISDRTRIDILDIVTDWEKDRVAYSENPDAEAEAVKQVADRIRHDLRVPKPKE